MSARAAISSLCLFESLSLEGGAVERVSLFGYRVGLEVVELEEAVRLVSEGGDPQTPGGHTGHCDDGAPCAGCAEAFAHEVDAELEEEDVDPTPAQVRPCLECSRGARGNRCGWCLGRKLRAWVGDPGARREIVRNPPATEADRLGLAFALADCLPLAPELLPGALGLLHLALQGAEPSTRTRALQQWKWALGGMAVAS